MDNPWQEVDASVLQSSSPPVLQFLQKAISSNHVKFGGKESNG
jgi:hypothetical protein